MDSTQTVVSLTDEGDLGDATFESYAVDPCSRMKRRNKISELIDQNCPLSIDNRNIQL